MMSASSVQAKQQSEYKERINKCHDEKRILYERFVLGEIAAKAFKIEKVVLDAEFDRLNSAFEIYESEAAEILAAKASSNE